MMANLRKLSWLDITLILILVVGAAIIYFASQAKIDTELEKTRLETRSRAAELNLNEADKGASLESLRQRLEQTRTTLAEITLPAEVHALGVTDQILKYADKNNITIVSWNCNYTSVSRETRQYLALLHNLSITGKTDDLIAFVEALTSGSVAPTIQTVNTRGVEGERDKWQTEIGLLIYYH